VGADLDGESEDVLRNSQEHVRPANTDATIDFDYAQTIIRDCWSKIKDNRDLGRSEVKEVLMAPDTEKENVAAVRMWCDVLRLRG
jgi:hypothetical protein